jgi:L,D-transpeptidase ErfK/SrfK
MNRKILQVAAVIAGALLTGEWASVSVRAEASAPISADQVREQERIVEERAGPAQEVAESVARDVVIDREFDVIGTLGAVTSVYEDTLVDIARSYGVGYEEIRRANPGIDTWLPGEGTTVRLPTRFVLPRAQRDGLVINLAEYRMYYFSSADGDTLVTTYPISIGRMDWATPMGRSSVVKKVKNPSWYPPQSIRDEWAADGRELAERVFPGPDNPLGEYSMRLSIPGYLIHGTNRPAGVGMRVTHGCIRMFPEDIERLYPDVPVDTPVQIVNQPYKFGWDGDDLYLEAHPPLEMVQRDEVGIQATDTADPWGLTSIIELYIRVTEERPADVDWRLFEETHAQQLGIPVKIGRARKAGGAALSASRQESVER